MLCDCLMILGDEIAMNIPKSLQMDEIFNSWMNGILYDWPYVVSSLQRSCPMLLS